MPRKPAQKRIDDAIELLNQHRRDWLRRPGVTAVDVGFKISNNKITDALALRVHVERKKPLAELEEHEIFNISGTEATTKKKPKKVGAFPIDVIEAAYEPSPMVIADPEDAVAVNEAIDRKGLVSPLIGGVSCGNARVTAGTLACIVFDRADGSPLILSNWHVLAGSRDAVSGEEIWQPGRVDGGNSGRTVARLSRFRLDRDMDAAVAALNTTRPHVRDIIGLNPVSGMESPQLGMQVAKSGRTTGNTEGIIDGVSLSTSINYGAAGVVSFRDQIHIVPRPPWPAVDYEVSMGGDSGSIWINEATGKAVGLHFAGETTASPTAENAIANRIVRVAEELNFSFLPVIAPTPPVEPPPLPSRNALRAILCRLLPFLCGGSQGAQMTPPPADHLCSCGGHQLPEQVAPAAAPAMAGDVIDLIIDAVYADLASRDR